MRTSPVVHDFTGDGLADLAMRDVDACFSPFERVHRDGVLIPLPPRRAFANAEGKPLRFKHRHGL